MKNIQPAKGIMKAETRIARLAQTACMWEACAPKPGNVNRLHDFEDTTLEDFLCSALAVGSAFENAGRVGVGEAIWQAAADTRRLVRSNTNLGIILLLVPMIRACLNSSRVNEDRLVIKEDLDWFRKRLGSVLESLTKDDARLTYAAIRLAQPAGLGRVPHADVAGEPSVTLLEAMELAKDRDSIASEYVTHYQITFEMGLPAFEESLLRGAPISDAIVQTFLTVLKKVPDTLIARKKGPDAAREVSRRAGAVLAAGGMLTPRGRKEVAAMDQQLRDPGHTLNPGTTADLTAAAIFLYLLKNTVQGFRLRPPGFGGQAAFSVQG
jgi:triphosphoribosyl-dephospho-CoA synthase